MNTVRIKFTPDNIIRETTVSCGSSLFVQSKPLPEKQAPSWGPKVLALDGGGMRGVVSLESGMHNILYLVVKTKGRHQLEKNRKNRDIVSRDGGGVNGFHF